MPHVCPSEGQGHQPRAGAAGALGTSGLAPAALARESSPCLHMAGRPEKIGQELPPFSSLYPHVLPQHRDLLTRFQLTSGLNPLCVHCPQCWLCAQSK